MKEVNIFFPDLSWLCFKIDLSINRCTHIAAIGSVVQQLKDETGQAHEKYQELTRDGEASSKTQKSIFEYLKQTKGTTPKW